MHARLYSPILSILLAALLTLSPPPANAQGPAAPATDQASLASDRFDPVAATEAYLARMSPEQRARSNAYFEGGYWILLWNFLFNTAVGFALLSTGLSARMQRAAARITSWNWLQPLFYGALYLAITTLVALPVNLYQEYFREHQYGMSNQTLGAWFADAAKGLAISAIFGGIAVMGLYAILRRVRETWWIWASVGLIALLFVATALGPVYIAPLFNQYHALDDPALRDPILSMARANQIPAARVYVFDASRQTKRVSANVSGALGTIRISLNDNLLARCSPASVRAVMAHEMGHYVMNHVYKGLLMFGLLLTFGFAFCAWAFDRVVARWGASWGIVSIADPAGLPLIALLIGVYLFLATPIINTIIRTNEVEADAFGLNAAREPDGFAEAALMLAEYRKMRPGTWEEIIFYDHPSGYNRILAAMTWKAEHLPNPAAGH